MRVEKQLQPGEEILFRAYVTWLTLLPFVALGVAALIGAAVAQSFKSTGTALVLLAVAALSGLLYLWKDFVRKANDYVLTNHRIIREVGIVSRRSMDSRLDKINNVEHRQTLWGRLLDYGDVEIDTASETGAALFSRISHPLAFKNAILAAAEQYRGAASRMPLAAPAAPSGAERMRQLKTLLDDGLISPEEYEAKRRELLAQL